jgi:uncharacterized protein YfaP (DUF2135 family)
MAQRGEERSRNRPAWLTRAIAAARVARHMPQLFESLSAASTAANMAGDRAGARLHLDEAEAITQRSAHYPASIALIQAQATHALFEGNLAAAGARRWKVRGSAARSATCTTANGCS